MNPTHVTKFPLAHRLHNSRINFCDWRQKLSNVTKGMRLDAIDGTNQTKQILNSVTIKCDIEFTNCSII